MLSTRMSREFSLVLLGAGVLTTGYMLAPAPEQEMEQKAEQQAAERTGHGTRYRSSGGMFIWIHSSHYAGTPSGRPAAYSPTTRSGGFGAAGRSFSGGGS